MSIPMIPNNPYYKLTIPEMSGGVNLRDGISLIKDNQMTDCKNVWYRNGILKTRPGVSCAEDLEVSAFDLESDNFKVYNDEKNFRVIDGITYFLVCFQFENRLVLRYYSANKENPDYLEVATIFDIPGGDFSCNIFQYETDIYIFCSGYYERMVYDSNNPPFYIFKITEKIRESTSVPQEWETTRILQRDIYIPTIAHNGTGYAPQGYATAADILAGMDMLEGFNLLGNRFKLIYSTVDKERLGEVTTETTPSHYMSYSVPYSGEVPELIPQLLKVDITWNQDGAIFTATHTLDPNTANPGGVAWEESDFNTKDRRKMRVGCNGDMINIEFISSGEGESAKLAIVNESHYVLNNMEITAPCKNTEENYRKVLDMTFNEWYGGSSEGLYGGIQLFLGGNRQEKDKALVVWSDVNRPLYFSENCYAYAGDKSQKVYAFGKQGEALIIGKEKETYATKYNSIDEPLSAEDVSSQAVVDVTSNETTFPMMQVHGNIGCDCPNTMKLCRNRLVWLNSDGKVYTLVSASQWTERSIYEVSGMIESRLKQYTAEELKNAIAADWQGYYVLIIKTDMYLMDYNSYGFSNVYSYSKTEDAQMSIPWWIWELPDGYTNAVVLERLKAYSAASVAGKLYFSTFSKAVIRDTVTQKDIIYIFPEMLCFDENSKSDIYPCYDVGYSASGSVETERTLTKRDIPTMLQTKFFDFGSPTVKKTTPKIEVVFGTNGGTPINATVITESSTEENEIIIDEPEGEEYSAGYFQNRLIRLGNKHSCRIALKLQCEGDMAVDAINLQYKQIGGLK